MSSRTRIQSRFSSKFAKYPIAHQEEASNETTAKMSPKSQNLLCTYSNSINGAPPQRNPVTGIKHSHRSPLDVTSELYMSTHEDIRRSVDPLKDFTDGCPGNWRNGHDLHLITKKVPADFHDKNSSLDKLSEDIPDEANQSETLGNSSGAYSEKTEFISTLGYVNSSANGGQKAPCRTEFDKNNKTSVTYISLIAKAILSSPHRRLVLKDIYLFVSSNFPEICNRGSGWRNSIRHNLSLNNCFVKVGRSPCGKGHYWGISPSSLPEFLRGNFRRKRSTKFAWKRPFQKYSGLHIYAPDYSRIPIPYDGSYHGFSSKNIPQDKLQTLHGCNEQSDVMKVQSNCITDCYYCNPEHQLYLLTQNVSEPPCCSAKNYCCIIQKQAVPKTILHMDTVDTKIINPYHEWCWPSTQYPLRYLPNITQRFCSSTKYHCIPY